MKSQVKEPEGLLQVRELGLKAVEVAQASYRDFRN